MRRYPLLGLIVFLTALTLSAFAPSPDQSVEAASASGGRITINYDGFMIHTAVSAPTVRGALLELGLPTYETTLFFPTSETTIASGLIIHVDNPTAVTLDVDGEKRALHTHATSIAALLAEAGTTLGELDEIDTPESTHLISGQTISIIRVHETTELRTESIPYDSRTENNPSLPLGQTKVAQAGQTGTKELEYRIVFRNGEKVAEELLGEKILTEPTPEIIDRGTRQPIIAAPIAVPQPQNAGTEVGSASWYGANGFVAASRDYAKGTRLRVTNLNNGQSIDVTVVTYGPQAWTGHLIDLSPDAFSALAPLGAGILRNVSVEPV